jgi:hypothetical protein
MLRPPPIITGLKPTELNDGQAEARRLRSDLAGLLQDQAHTGLVCAAHQRDCRDATEETSRLSERRSAAAERLVAAQQAMDAATAESKRLAALRITLEQHQKPNTIEQIVGLPTLRPNPKRQVGLLLRYNKLYMMHTWRNGVRLGPNPEHFIVTDGTPPVARAKPTAGIPVTEDTIAGDIRRLLTQFPANDWVVAVVVCEDSFGAFQTVKIAILEAGYEYRPLSLARGKAIADTGGQSESQ